MKIEVKPKTGRNDILTIFMEGEPWRDIHIAIFGRFPFLPSYSSVNEWMEAFTVLEYKRVKNYVIRRLAAQSYHSQQLAQLLSKRLVPARTIEKIICQCQEWGYLNDEAWLGSFIRGHQKRQGLRGVMAKLQAKGLSSESLQQVREKWITPEEERQIILHLIQTRYSKKDLTQYLERQKVMASLMRKGYDFELIKAALEEKDY